MSEDKGGCGCQRGGSTPAGAAPDGSAVSSNGAWVSTYRVPKMDCSSEEHMIRLALESVPQVRSLRFDLAQRQLQAVHDGPAEPITARLTSLGLGATLAGTVPAGEGDMGREESELDEASELEARTLKIMLAINAAMFLIEFVMGLVAQSTGLLADSLDNFADASVFGLALFAVGKSMQHKLRAAHVSGWLQLTLAVGALVQVVRHFVLGSEPQSAVMMGISALALIANVSCLRLMHKHRDQGAHMKASWIFFSNDVLANVGVIIAGALVAWTHSPYPDLFIGTIIGLVVLNGARRILALKG